MYTAVPTTAISRSGYLRRLGTGRECPPPLDGGYFSRKTWQLTRGNKGPTMSIADK
jgi:hypothetical protein